MLRKHKLLFPLSGRTGFIIHHVCLDLMAQNGGSKVSGNRTRETRGQHVGSDP